jgi:hypothetical protein
MVGSSVESQMPCLRVTTGHFGHSLLADPDDNPSTSSSGRRQCEAVAGVVDDGRR